MQRLLEAAKVLKNIQSTAELSRFLNESEQTLNNWTRRGVPAAKIMQLSRAIGCNPFWLETGEGMMTLVYAKDDAEARTLTMMHKMNEEAKHYMIKIGDSLSQPDDHKPKNNGTV